jgi:CxxC-x17-CxxC domain-containing protein
MYTDRTLTCADCGQEFVFTASEQAFFAERGFTEPRRCGSCRAARKLARGGDDSRSTSGGSYGSRGPREMHDAICSSCGRATQVPFRPTSGKPVYCSDCFAARR